MNISKNQKNHLNQIQRHRSCDLFISSDIDIQQLKNYISENKDIINIPDNKGETLLSYSIMRNKMQKIQYILTLKNLNLNYYDKSGKSYLHKAVEYSNYILIKQLIEKGININNQDNQGNTPLHLATMKNDIKSIKILINNKANIRIKNNNNETSLIIAQKLGYLKLIKAFTFNNNTNCNSNIDFNHNDDSVFNIITNPENEKRIDCATFKKLQLYKKNSDNNLQFTQYSNNNTFPNKNIKKKSHSINNFVIYKKNKNIDNIVINTEISNNNISNNISNYCYDNYSRINTENNIIYQRKKLIDENKINQSIYFKKNMHLNSLSQNLNINSSFINKKKDKINSKSFKYFHFQPMNQINTSISNNSNNNLCSTLPNKRYCKSSYNQKEEIHQIDYELNLNDSQKTESMFEGLNDVNLSMNSIKENNKNKNKVTKTNTSEKQFNDLDEINDESVVLSYSPSQSIFSYTNNYQKFKERLSIPGVLLYTLYSKKSDIAIEEPYLPRDTVKLLTYNINTCVSKLRNDECPTFRSNNNLFSSRKNVKKSTNYNGNDLIIIENNTSHNIKLANSINNDLYLLLRNIKMEKYFNNFVINGFDDINLIIQQCKNDGITIKNLQKCNIKLIGDCAKIIVYFNELSNAFPFKNYDKDKIFISYNDTKNSFYIQLLNWLSSIKMEMFIDNFIYNGYYSLDLLLIQMLSKQPINDNHLEEEFKITKIGYRARIINKLKEDSIKYCKNMIDKYGKNNLCNIPNKYKDKLFFEFYEQKDIDLPCNCLIF